MSLIIIVLLLVPMQSIGIVEQATEQKNLAIKTHAVNISLGVRPIYLVENMRASQLKDKLMSCVNNPPKKSDFSIGHRGAPMQFPEHTKESYLAAARQGAGVIECDVTFTADLQLVCRHSQCDLHTTTNILEFPELAKKCTVPFKAADHKNNQPAEAQCCTSDITLKEFKTLQGKMDFFYPLAQSIHEYMTGPAGFELKSFSATGELMTLQESIQLFEQLGVKHTPELKQAMVDMPFKGHFSQQDYAQSLIDSYQQADVGAGNVWLQSFNQSDIEYWLKVESKYAEQAIYLDDSPYQKDDFSPTVKAMKALKSAGINTIAPPVFALLSLDAEKNIVASNYAKYAQQAGLDIVTWSLERSGSLRNGGGFYFQSISPAIERDGDVFEVLHVLTKDVGIKGVFSDWPATTTFYANCFGLD